MRRTMSGPSSKILHAWHRYVTVLLVALTATLSITSAQPIEQADAAPTPHALSTITCNESSTSTLDKPLGLTGETISPFSAVGKFDRCSSSDAPFMFFGAEFTMKGYAIQSRCTKAAFFTTEGALTWKGGSIDGDTNHFVLLTIATVGTVVEIEGKFTDGALKGASIKALPMSADVTRIIHDCNYGKLSQVEEKSVASVTK